MKTSGKTLLILVSGFLMGVVMLFNSCQGHPFVPAHGSSTLGNPMHFNTSFAAGQYQKISSLSVCMSQMVLMTVSGEQVTVPFAAPTEQAIPVSGTDLWTVSVPNGQYTKINLVLANVCGTNESLSLTNVQGTFNTTSTISLEFSGNEFIGSGGSKVVFDFQAIATALSQAQSNSNVASLASSTQSFYHSSGCGMQTNASAVAFCDSFDQPSAFSGRSGQLNGSIWTVARSGPSNQGQGDFDGWATSTIDACGSLQPAQPDSSDVLLCNGQVRESSSDAGAGASSLSMSPRQAFDFAGRTGTVAFDFSNDTSGSSGYWPEFWLSDQSLPSPKAWRGFQSVSNNAVGFTFDGNLAPYTGAQAPNCPNDGYARWIVGSVSLVQNYVTQVIGAWDGNPKFQITGCVIASDGSSGKMNHVEIHFSQNQIEVWASDAGSPNLKQIALVQNISLPFSRGYIAMTDNHSGANQSHTFAWDNVAFDGPVVKRDLAFAVADSLTPGSGGLTNLGWQSQPSTPAAVTSAALSASDVSAANTSGLGASLTMNFYVAFNPLTTIHYTINGTAFSATIPFADAFNQYYSIELPVPASALVTGAQVISVWSDDVFVIYNLDIKLNGAGL